PAKAEILARKPTIAASPRWRGDFDAESIRHRPDIGRAWPYQPSHPLLLAGMRRPPRGTRDRKDRRKRLSRDLQRVEQDRGEKFHIGVERPLRIFPLQGGADIGLDLAGERKIGAINGEPPDRLLQ